MYSPVSYTHLPYESGVCKMMVVGLGKQKGAESVHSDGLGNMARNLPANAKVVVENSNILFAIPCVENAYDETEMCIRDRDGAGYL